MPNQCVHCGRMYEDAAPELLKGCGCGSHFFFFVRKQQLEDLQKKTIELEEVDKERVEKDVREMIGLEEEKEVPVILDLESVRITGPGKFEIDVVNLFSKKRPLIYKLEEGKYIIDLASAFKQRGEGGKIKGEKEKFIEETRNVEGEEKVEEDKEKIEKGESEEE